MITELKKDILNCVFNKRVMMHKMENDIKFLELLNVEEFLKDYNVYQPNLIESSFNGVSVYYPIEDHEWVVADVDLPKVTSLFSGKEEFVITLENGESFDMISNDDDEKILITASSSMVDAITKISNWDRFIRFAYTHHNGVTND